MKDYHSYQKKYIGCSDVAALTLVGCHKDSPMDSMVINFGGDGDYNAYIVDEDAEIGNHYYKVAEYDWWMKIYDDTGLVYESPYGKHVDIFRSGDYGIIIKIGGKTI